MRFKYNHGGETYELAVAETKLISPTGVVWHSGANHYVPVVNTTDKNASHLRVRRNGIIRAPIRYFDEPIDMLDGRTLADVQQIFQAGLGKYYFKAGDFFDVTFPTEITLDANSIAADSTWRVVCLGIDHNAEIEGYNRGHFAIGRNTDNVNIAFHGKRMNATNPNEGGWAATDMRAWLNSTFFDALPTDLQAVISPCTKINYFITTTGFIISSTTTSDKLWLPGAFEVSSAWNSIIVGVNNNRVYDYCYSAVQNKRFNHNNPTTTARWWTRTAQAPSPEGAQNNFRSINNNGNNSSNAQNNVWAFVPCFTIA